MKKFYIRFCKKNISNTYIIIFFYGLFGFLFFFFMKNMQCITSPFENVFRYQNNKTLAVSAAPLSEDAGNYSSNKIMLFKRPNIYKLNVKEVFLTFDDGPSSKNTLRILNILKKNDVKATFFVVGKKVEESPNILKKLSDNGMCIAAHSYSHEYKIYRSSDDYFKDLKECNAVIDRVIGYHEKRLVRLPGGSSNLVYGGKNMIEIRNLLKDNNMDYVDWNINSADATSKSIPSSTIIRNISKQCKYNSVAVILMHDSSTKTTTVDALPDVIRILKQNNYIFRTFHDLTRAEKGQLLKRKIMNR